jgi:tetratricopeptide (TPR) repeat protein
MADKTENTEIEYTPEELEEIERIVDSLPGSSSPDVEGDIVSLKTETEPQESDELEDEEEPSLENMDFGEIPSELITPGVSDETSEDITETEESIDLSTDIGDLGPLPDDFTSDSITDFDNDLPDFDDFDSVSADVPTSDDIPSLDSFDAPTEPEQGELLDITDSIQEISDFDVELPDFQSDSLPSFEDESTLSDSDQVPDFDNVDLSDIDLPPIEGEEPQKPAFKYTPKTKPSGISPDSTLGQLNELTKDEPESLDENEISSDAFLEAGDEDLEQENDQFEDAPAELGEISNDDEPLATLDGGVEGDAMPDLDSLDLSAAGGLAEGDLSDLPEVDLGSIESPTADFSSDLGELDSLGDLTGTESHEELSEIGSELGDFDSSAFESMDDISSDLVSPSRPPQEEIAEDVGTLEPIESLSAMDDELPDLSSDIPIFDDVDEGTPQDRYASETEEKKGAEFTADELKKIKTALLLFPTGLTNAIKDTILNDRLNEDDTRRLADMILQGRPEDNIHRFLEKRLKQKIDKDEEGAGGGRRVIIARPEYSTEGRIRQKILLQRTRNIAIGAVAGIAVLIAGYRLIYIPQRAKSLIAKGTQLIRQFSEEKFQDYKMAEEIFTDVDENYIKDYIYGYNEYGRAYFDKKEYYRSLIKLNEAYDLGVEKKFSTKESVRTLNELGHFYSAKKRGESGEPGSFEDFFQKSVKLNLNEYYFNKIPALQPIETQYDLALDFYLKALNQDPKNVESMLGIGDVYQNKGEFLKARTYYENILSVDKNSIVGHSGLINLFIEQDNFQETITEYVGLRDRNDLEKLSSPLLVKLAKLYAQ